MRDKSTNPQQIARWESHLATLDDAVEQHNHVPITDDMTSGLHHYFKNVLDALDFSDMDSVYRLKYWRLISSTAFRFNNDNLAVFLDLAIEACIPEIKDNNHFLHDPVIRHKIGIQFESMNRTTLGNAVESLYEQTKNVNTAYSHSHKFRDAFFTCSDMHDLDVFNKNFSKQLWAYVGYMRSKIADQDPSFYNDWKKRVLLLPEMASYVPQGFLFPPNKGSRDIISLLGTLSQEDKLPTGFLLECIFYAVNDMRLAYHTKTLDFENFSKLKYSPLIQHIVSNMIPELRDSFSQWSPSEMLCFDLYNTLSENTDFLQNTITAWEIYKSGRLVANLPALSISIGDL